MVLDPHSGSLPVASSSIPREPAAQCIRLGVALGVLVAVGYFGFLLTGAFAPQFLARPAVGHVPWSFVLGAGLLVGVVSVTGIYVLYANAADSRAENRT